MMFPHLFTCTPDDGRVCRPKHVEWTCREINFTEHCRICWLFHRIELCLDYNKPTRCSCSQSILFHCKVTLHVSEAFHTHHQEYINLYLQPPVQVMLSLQLPSSNVAKFVFTARCEMKF